MGILGGVKDKLSANHPIEEAIDAIGKEVAQDVEKGDFEAAKNTLQSLLSDLENGEFEVNRKKWDSPEEEAEDLVNRIFLYILEVAVKDLEGIDKKLRPPIVTSFFKMEDGLKGEVEKLLEMHNELEEAYPDEILNGTPEANENTPDWYVEEYMGYSGWTTKRPRFQKMKEGVKIKVKKWKWICKKEAKVVRNIREVLGTDQKKDHENNGDDRVFQNVVKARRRIEFIEELANWEQSQYGLKIDQSELQEIKEVHSWVNEREKIIREIEKLLNPLYGQSKFEHFENPEEVRERFEKTYELVTELREHEGSEDKKLSKLEGQLP